MARKLIAIDDGHGMETAGKRTPTLYSGKKSETGNFMHENEFNREVANILKVELERHGFDTLMVAPTDYDTPLSARTNLANSKKADIYVSIHANANNGQWSDAWGGIETYAMPSGESRKLGAILHKHLLQGSKLQDRKLRDGSHLWVIRKTIMPAVLVECGFMDSKKDIDFLLSKEYRRECAIELAKGICEYYGVTYKSSTEKTSSPQKQSPSKPSTQPSKPTLKEGVKNISAVKELQTLLNKKGFKLKVDGIFGSGTEKEVKNFQKKNGLKDDGIVGANTWQKLLYVEPAKPVAKPVIEKKPEVKNDLNDGILFRVIAGSYSSESEARKQIAYLKSKGFDSFVAPYDEKSGRIFRVVIGTFDARKNAEDLVKRLKSQKVDSFLLAIKK